MRIIDEFGREQLVELVIDNNGISVKEWKNQFTKR